MTLTDMQATALNRHFDEDDRGFRFFSDFVESKPFPWVTDKVADRAVEIAIEGKVD